MAKKKTQPKSSPKNNTANGITPQSRKAILEKLQSLQSYVQSLPTDQNASAPSGARQQVEYALTLLKNNSEWLSSSAPEQVWNQFDSICVDVYKKKGHKMANRIYDSFSEDDLYESDWNRIEWPVLFRHLEFLCSVPNSDEEFILSCVNKAIDNAQLSDFAENAHYNLEYDGTVSMYWG